MPAGSKTKKKAVTSFPHLRKPPITEAVIEVRGPVGVEWNEEAVILGMQEFNTEYPVHLSLQGFQSQWQLTPGNEPKMKTKNLGTRGVRFQSKDGFNVALFTADLFSFSRLNSYQTWDTFVSEALKLWRIYKRVVQQNDVVRLGVRFINRIPVSEEKIKIEKYFKDFPSAVPGNDPDRLMFLHQDIISIPQGNLKANIIKTVQPGSPADPRAGLILDIDVFDENRFVTDEALLNTRLEQIHHWKNWVFFNIVTKRLVEERV